MDIKNLNLDIDNESVNIYIDNGEDKDIVSLLYWHIDEFEEDGESALAMATAIHLYYTNPKQLLDLYNII